MYEAMPIKPHTRITLKMIAQKAGVSVGTVDRALNNRAGINEESKQLVLSVAKTLGYKPNRLASALSRKRVVKIGMLYPDRPTDFYYDIDAGINMAAEELHDFGIMLEKIRYSPQDATGADTCLAALDLQSFDGFAVNAAGSFETRHFDRIAGAGIPVITFNTDAPESKRLFYIGNHSRESGRLGGEILDMILRGEGSVTVIGNFAQSMPFLERFSGFFEYLQLSASTLRVIPCIECRSDPMLAADGLKNLLTQTPDIRGVFCVGHSGTVGAINALKELGRRDIHIVGYDVTRQTADALREGWCDALLYQEPFDQGYQAARLLARHIIENWTPERAYLYLDTHVVLRSNLDSYLNRNARVYGNMRRDG